MGAFVPINYILDTTTYVIPVKITRKGSPMETYEYVPRSLLESVIKDSLIEGITVEPYICYGFH